MKDYKKYTPEGLRDMLSNEATIKLWIQKVLQEKFGQYGYQFIETPTFEYLDVFTLGSKSYQNQELYSWVNRQGEIVALRSDQTKAIARVIANNYPSLQFPKRYAYISSTFRCPKAYQGKMHEFTQAGIELVGDASLQSEIEVIVLAIESIKACKLKDFTIHIGSATFVYEMLATIGLTPMDTDKVYQAIKAKDAVSIRRILDEYKGSEDFATLLLDLMQRSGKIELLKSIKGKLSNPLLIQSLEKLEQLYEQLVVFGVEEYILFDFSILSYASYYTGIMFQGYTGGIGQVIVEGGRYDTLLENFDIVLPAVGMAINVNLLLQKYQDLHIPEPTLRRTLVVWEDGQLADAIQIATKLRDLGECVQYAVSNRYTEQVRYARESGMACVVYLKEDQTVEVACKPDWIAEEMSLDAWMNRSVGGVKWKN